MEKANQSSDTQEVLIYGTKLSSCKKIKITGDPRRTAMPKKSDVP